MDGRGIRARFTSVSVQRDSLCGVSSSRVSNRLRLVHFADKLSAQDRAAHLNPQQCLLNFCGA
jgi:hypothetical protein